MTSSRTPSKPSKVCFVQPVQSPYWTARLRALAADDELRVYLLLERESFAHRPGWRPEPIKGIDTVFLGSSIVATARNGKDLGYEIKGVRSIPWRLLPVLWRYRPDVTVVCNSTQLLLALPYKWLKKGRLAIIVEDTPHSTRNLGRLSAWIKAWIYRRADAWFAFSEDAQRYLKGIGLESGVRRSYWSLDMLTFQRGGALEEKSVKCLQTCDHSCTVIFVGALVVNKGVALLLESWRHLSASVRGRSRLVLVGSGPMSGEVQAYIQKNDLAEVETVGQVPYETVRDLLARSDLLVLPTLQDLYSLTVIEAMACGCAVITTPFNGARELVIEGETGWIVDPTAPQALTRALEHALSTEVDLPRMGEAARQQVTRLDNREVMRLFAKFLHEIAEGK